MDEVSVNTHSVFCFEKYAVDYINYNVNPQFELDSKMNINLQMGVRTEVDSEKSKGQVTIKASFFKNKVGNYPFTLELSLTGYFSMSNITDTEILRKCIRVNGTTALFPFLRSTVADITKAANVQPLIMPLINIHRLLEEQERQEKEEREKEEVKGNL
jgi:preprotein translocase subunit SecB